MNQRGNSYLDFAIGDALMSPGMRDLHFRRCNDTHHSFAVAQDPHASSYHASLEIRGVEEWTRGSGKILRSGARMVWGPGRHNAGDNTMAYFLGGAGHNQRRGPLASGPVERHHVTTRDQCGRANEMNELVARESFNDVDKGLFMAPLV